MEWSKLTPSRDISETMVLPSDDPEAIAYLKREDKPPNVTNSNDEIPTATSTFTGPIQTTQNESATGHITSASSSPAAPVPTTASTAAPAARPRGPLQRRKPRQSLEAMSAALDKGKKMTTLEKVRAPSPQTCAASQYPSWKRR